MFQGEFRAKLERLINAENAEARSNTPDFVLAEYLHDCLGAFDRATKARDDWYGIEPRPGWSRNTPHASRGSSGGEG